MEADGSFGLVWVLLLLLGITDATGREGGSSPHIPKLSTNSHIIVTEQKESLTQTNKQTAAGDILVLKLLLKRLTPHIHCSRRDTTRRDRRAGPTAFSRDCSSLAFSVEFDLLFYESKQLYNLNLY